jgi:endonuclease/exonuclease/phosphatase (EEP) superfamily protein YafD
MGSAANPIRRLADVVAKAGALALGAGCLVAALASQGGRTNPALDLLTHFTILWLLGGLITAAYGAAFTRGRWRLALVSLGAAAALAAGVLMVPELTRPIRPNVAAGGGYQIKLIEFNAWERNTQPQAAADWLAAQKPDIIVMPDAEPPIRKALSQKGFYSTHGIADTMIFSRTTRAPSPFIVPMYDWPLLPSFARASFDSPAGPYSVVAVHLTRPTDPGQIRWALPLNDLFDRYDRSRLIVAGDFNLTPWSFGLHRLDQKFGLERRDRDIPTWPALFPLRRPFATPLPILPIDHVYAGQAWRTVKIERGPSLGSDHYPLIITLALQP